MQQRQYNGKYECENLNRIAFPLGGIGAGMICLEGTGALSHVSLRHKPDLLNEPQVFSAICIKNAGKNDENIARVLVGPVPDWKIMGIGGGTGAVVMMGGFATHSTNTNVATGTQGQCQVMPSFRLLRGYAMMR